jgi:amino acid transporter
VTIPVITYAFLGLEIFALTALEAHRPKKSLKYPATLTAWITAAIYFFSALAFYLNVGWQDPSLPGLPDRIAQGNLTATLSTNGTQSTQSQSIVVIALRHANIPTLIDFFNGCLILTVLSTANTILYAASRALFGVTKEVNRNDKHWGWISKFSETTRKRRVSDGRVANIPCLQFTPDALGLVSYAPSVFQRKLKLLLSPLEYNQVGICSLPNP